MKEKEGRKVGFPTVTFLFVLGPSSKTDELHKEEIDAAVTTLHDWTNLGMLNLPLHFGNMPSDRYAQWERSFRELKRKINRHEGIDD